MPPTDPERGAQKIRRRSLAVALLGLAWLLFQLFPITGEPIGTDGRWVVGYTFGAPANVRVPDQPTNQFTGWTSCTITYHDGREDTDRVDCRGAAWTDAGRRTSGNLVGQAKDLVPNGSLVPFVDARVIGGTAYTQPNGMHYVFAVVAAGLFLTGLGGAAASTVALRRGKRASAESAASAAREQLTELAKRHDLGAVITIHRSQPDAFNALRLEITAPIAVATTVGVLTEVTVIGAIIFAVVAAVTWLITVLQMWSGLRRRTRRGAVAAVCQNGLLLWSPEKTVAAPWPSSEFIGKSSALSSEVTAENFAIRSPSGEVAFDRNQWEHFEKLREDVRRNVVAAAASRAQAALDAGESIRIGEFVLSPAGLNHGDVTLPYDEIRSVTADYENLVILPRRAVVTPLRGALSDIPNVDVLFSLVNSRRRQASGGW